MATINQFLQMRGAGPSAHLSWQELECRDGTKYPKAFIEDGRVFKLARLFEEIRFIWGKPIRVLSAYRTPEYNRSVHGAPKSQHIQGRALDLAPPTGVTIEEFYNSIKERVGILEIKGLGKYPTWVHVDVRPTAKIAYW